MTLIQLLVSVALIGLVVWAIQTLVPMPEQFKRAVYVIAVIICVLLVLSAFGLLPAGLTARVS